MLKRLATYKGMLYPAVKMERFAVECIAGSSGARFVLTQEGRFIDSNRAEELVLKIAQIVSPYAFSWAGRCPLELSSSDITSQNIKPKVL
jgi:hypothetical protein